MLTKKQLRDAAGCVGHCEDCSVPAEAQQQELEKLKELTENLKELTARHIFHKMTPSTCSIPIQVLFQYILCVGLASAGYGDMMKAV